MIGVVLGSGLGGFAESLEDRIETPFEGGSVAGHAGKWIEGRIGQQAVLVMAGRRHLYQGFSAQEVTFGIREMARRGVRDVILTNAAGAINMRYRPGDLVLIADHINLQGTSPLLGGPNFVDMTDAYDAKLRTVAKRCDPSLQEGVYAGVLGPQYETPAEIRYLRAIGADLVGMSTVMETIAANPLGMRVLGISCVTNMAAGVTGEKLSHAEVLATGQQVHERLTALLRNIIATIAV